MRGRALLLILLASACASSRASSRSAVRDSAATVANTQELPTASDAAAETLLVDVRALDSTIVADMRYATANNFTGAPLPGYGANRALLRREAAAALARVQRRVTPEGLTLRIYDAYRPVRATLAMVDLTLAEGSGPSARELDMGTAFDTFSAAAHTANAAGAVAERRRRLVAAMAAEGFTNYDQEWWHFSYAVPDPVRFDLPIR